MENALSSSSYRVVERHHADTRVAVNQNQISKSSAIIGPPENSVVALIATAAIVRIRLVV